LLPPTRERKEKEDLQNDRKKVRQYMKTKKKKKTEKFGNLGTGKIDSYSKRLVLPRAQKGESHDPISAKERRKIASRSRRKKEPRVLLESTKGGGGGSYSKPVNAPSKNPLTAVLCVQSDRERKDEPSQPA